MNTPDQSSRESTERSERTSLIRLISLSAASLILGSGLAIWLEARGAASYSGHLQSRTTLITAPCLSKVRDVAVSPGQRVAPGDKLLELSDDRLVAAIVDKKRELIEVEAELERVKATAEVELNWRRRELQSEILDTQLKVSTMSRERQTKQVEHLAWQDYLNDRNSLVQGSDIISASSETKPLLIDAASGDEKRLQMMLREDAALAAAESLTEQIELCEQQLDRLRKLDSELPTKIRVSTGVDLTETRLARTKSELESMERQKESLTISCPAHGIVGSVSHTQGDLVSPGECLIELYDDERRHLIASLPSSTVAKLKTGTKLTLLFPARQKRIGLVASIPPQAKLDNEEDSTDDSQVEVKIEPAGKLWPKVPVGSRVKVQLIQ